MLLDLLVPGAPPCASAALCLSAYNGANMAKDRDGNLVFMAKSAWDIGYQQERHPQVKFSATRER